MKRLFLSLAASAVIATLTCGCVPATPVQQTVAQEPESTPPQELAVPATDEASTKKEPATLAEKIIGTWVLEATPNPGSPSGIGTRLKLFTGTHWCVIQPDGGTGVTLYHHGGRYEIQGAKLKTTREFAGESTKGMIGNATTYAVLVNGDTMKQADAKGEYNEVWKRVK